MKDNIEHEVYKVRDFSVLKASYKNSVYYIAGKNDITSYVQRVQKISNSVNIQETLKKSLDLFLREHPEKNVLNVPMYDFVLLDDPKTTANFVNHVCSDIFHYTEKQCEDVVNALNSTGVYRIDTFSSEMCDTFGAMIESGNEQINQNLGWDKVPVASTSHYEASLSTLETLLRRDFPDDI